VVGSAVGLGVGEVVGGSVGAPVGAWVGDVEGTAVGNDVGVFVGAEVGADVGDGDGVLVGAVVGSGVGLVVGVAVGDRVRTTNCLISPSSQTENPVWESNCVHEVPSLLPEKVHATGDQLLFQPFKRSMLYWPSTTLLSKVYCNQPDVCVDAEQ
jgi:hypothetical protein